MVQRGALAVAKDRGELEQPRLAGRQQLLHGEFRRGMQVQRPAAAVGLLQYGGKSLQMRLQSRRDLQGRGLRRSEEHTSELQSLMRISYAVFCLQKNKKQLSYHTTH